MFSSKTRSRIAGVAAVLVATGWVIIFAAEAEPSMEEQMAAWMEFAQPGEHHEFLAKLEGTWKAEAKIWMEPGAPPQISQGTMINEMILGGRYMQGRYESSFMGSPFSGISFDGYDNVGQVYTSLWIDTMSTTMLVSRGKCDDTGKVRTMVGEYKDPLSGEWKKSKAVTRIVGRNQHVNEGSEQGADGEFRKSMEITFTRQ